VYGDHLLVAELHARIAVIGPDDELVTYLGASDDSTVERSGWPNELSPNGLRRPRLAAGEFHTPHGIAADATGHVYVSGWLIAGRLVKLTPTGRIR